MSELAHRTFRVTVDVTVAAHEIDDALAEKTKRLFHSDSSERDAEIAGYAARDQRLLTAALAHPASVARYMLRKAIWSLESVIPVDSSLEQVEEAQGQDLEFVEDLQGALSAEDYAFFREVCAEDLFYDNTTFFQDAFKVTQEHVQITDLSDSTQHEPTRGQPEH